MQTDEPIRTDTITIIASVLHIQPEALSAESSMDTVYQWDSLSNLRILVKLEQYLEKTISLSDLVSVRTVDDWVAISKHYSAKN